MTDTKFRLEDWLDDLCVRFIINLPQEELESVERICFQVEEAQWFYEDFIRPLDPTLPSLSLRAFCLRIFQHCPLLSDFSQYHHSTAFSEFLAYKTRVPVRGAIMLNEAMDEVVLVKGWKKGANWSFPRGKINKDEKDLDCAVREVYEETGFDIAAAGLAGDEDKAKFIEVTLREQNMRLYVFRGVPMDTHFEPRTRKEISKISWHRLSDLPTFKKMRQQQHHEQQENELAINANKFYMVAPFLVPLKKWIAQQRKNDAKDSTVHNLHPAYETEGFMTEEEAGPEYDRYAFGAQTGPRNDAAAVDTGAMDASDRLKRLLRVQPTTTAHQQHPSGRQPPPQLQPQPQSSEDKSNALLALLRSGSKTAPSDGLATQKDTMPHTPMEPSDQPPPMPATPHHHHRDPAQLSQLPSPPGFPIPSSNQTLQYHQPQMPPPPQPYTSPLMGSQLHGPILAPSPDPVRTRATISSQEPSTSSVHAPVVPSASKLPLPKLTSHSLALLNAFKQSSTSDAPQMPEQNRASAAAMSSGIPKRTPLSRQHEGLYPEHSFVYSGPPPSGTRADPQVPRPGHGQAFVELSARPSPTETQFTTAMPTRHEAKANAQESRTSQMESSKARSGNTVSGTGSPVSILQRPAKTRTNRRESAAVQTERSRSGLGMAGNQPSGNKSFQPQILRRPVPAQPSPTNTPQAISTMPQSLPFERLGSQSTDHKQALLALFSQSSPLAIPAPAVSPPKLSDVDANPGENGRSRVTSVASSGEERSVQAESSRSQTPGAPVSRDFLLGYLEGVARGYQR